MSAIENIRTDSSFISCTALPFTLACPRIGFKPLLKLNCDGPVGAEVLRKQLAPSVADFSLSVSLKSLRKSAKMSTDFSVVSALARVAAFALPKLNFF